MLSCLKIQWWWLARSREEFKSGLNWQVLDVRKLRWWRPKATTQRWSGVGDLELPENGVRIGSAPKSQEFGKRKLTPESATAPWDFQAWFPLCISRCHFLTFFWLRSKDVTVAVHEFSVKTVTIINVPRNGMMLFSMFSIDIFICFQCWWWKFWVRWWFEDELEWALTWFHSSDSFPPMDRSASTLHKAFALLLLFNLNSLILPFILSWLSGFSLY